MEIAALASIDQDDIYNRYRECNSDRLRYLRLLETDWPCANGVIRAFLDYTTDAIQYSNNPVVFRAINYGLALYSKNLGKDDPVRFSAFIQGIIDSLGQDLENLAICDEVTNSMWSPLSKTGLKSWLQQKKRIERVEELKITHFDNPAESVSRSMFNQLLTDGQKRIVLQECSWLAEVADE